MTQDDLVLLASATRYQEAYLAEARRGHHKSIPGPLVAEILRYIESTLPESTQQELESRLLYGAREPGAASVGHEGAKWRAYVAHRGRSELEKKNWRAWYGRYGKSKGAGKSGYDEAFSIQPPPMPSPEPQEDTASRELQSRPLMRGMPSDGAPMRFATMRRVLTCWSGMLAEQAIDQASRLENRAMAQHQWQALWRIEAQRQSVLALVNAWEAANDLLAEGILLNADGPAQPELALKLASIVEREALEERELVEKMTDEFPSLFTYLSILDEIHQPTEI